MKPYCKVLSDIVILDQFNYLTDTDNIIIYLYCWTQNIYFLCYTEDHY